MKTINVTVLGTAGWYNTKIVFVKGQTYSMTATGCVSPWPGGNCFPPSGNPVVQWNQSVSPTHNFCALVGRIGTNGTPFMVGGNYGPTVAPATGELYLAANDGGNFNDNSGQFNVTVTMPDCVPLSDLSGDLYVKADKIDAQLFNDWGVMLTVQCDVSDDTLVWTNVQKQNLIDAFTLIDTALDARTTRRFKDVFGGIEFRHVVTLPDGAGGRAQAANDGYVVEISSIGRGGTSRDTNRIFGQVNTGPYGLDVAGDQGIKATVTHELGHVFDYRTKPQGGQPDNGLFHWGGQYVLTSVRREPTSPDLGRVWESQELILGEYVPDHFLNWVFSSPFTGYVFSPDVYDENASDSVQRIQAYWIGGINFSDAGVPRGVSAGIQSWADTASARALIGMQALSS